VRNTRKRLQRSLRHQIRENFDEEQAFLDTTNARNTHISQTPRDYYRVNYI
jgi:hypothetical protein